ncbi:MAG: hypothetical protein A3B75_00185 [Candidatus Terrybacteria bacterium RIFCSPHIGHO2_02_FULL_43_14]|nr:MAG: hypothetical protein A3B75_00185 [Candidatus Terrybacteria bacterium RIFCSPHIGHO2_02_FULL_43_14]
MYKQFLTTATPKKQTPRNKVQTTPKIQGTRDKIQTQHKIQGQETRYKQRRFWLLIIGDWYLPGFCTLFLVSWLILVIISSLLPGHGGQASYYNYICNELIYMNAKVF